MTDLADLGLTDDERVRVEAFGIFDGDSVSPTILFELAAEQIEMVVSRIRARLAPAPVEGLLKTPDEMVDDLEWAKHGTGQLALALKDASVLVRDARRAWARANAIALRGSDGRSAELREADAALVCEPEQIALDAAEVAQEYAKGVARAIEQTGSMTQTQAGLVKAQLSLAGTGRDA
jgi:hypothetical protein